MIAAPRPADTGRHEAGRPDARLPVGLVEEVRERLSAGKRLRRDLPGGGRLHVDRQLPFLVVHRRPPDRDDRATDRLVTGQASYLVAPGDEDFLPELAELVEAVVDTLSETFGAFLLVEVWTATPAAEEVRDPMVRVVTPDQQGKLDAVDMLAEALEELRLDHWRPEIRRAEAKTAAPPGLPPLLEAVDANRLSCYAAGVELDPVFRDESGEPYPTLVRELTSQLSGALQRAAFAFSRERTSAEVSTWQSMGRREMLRSVRDVDAALDEICGAYDFLLAITPVDALEAWKRFQRAGFDEEPEFRYRPLTADPELLLRKLYAVPLEEIEDPTLDRLFREKLREGARELTMLAERNTHRFLPGSLQLHGGVEPELRSLAADLLTALDGDGDGGELDASENAEERTVDAEAFARLARGQFEEYRERYADFEANLEIRDDVAGLMVTRGTLLIDRALAVTPTRARALLHHEVGTHVLSWVNGRSQPLSIFRTGLAGYEVFQEGLAVLSEYLVGGLTRERLRLLAARVVAVDRLLEGTPFVDIFAELVDGCGVEPHVAFMATMRVTRAGGLTKDAVYLRGLHQAVAYLQDGGDPALPFIGKISLADVPVVEELLHRGVLRDPPLTPACFELSGTAERLEALRDGVSIVGMAGRPR